MVAVGIVIFLLWIYFRYFGPLIITFKKTSHTAKAPTKVSGKSACWDIYCSKVTTISAKGWREINTNIVFVPWPYINIPLLNLVLTPFGNIAYKIHTLNGLALKGIRNHLSIINNNYKKEITVLMYNMRDFPVTFKVGDKIAQVEFYKVYPTFMIETKGISQPIKYNKVS